MKPILLNLLGAMAAGTALNLQLCTAVAQGTGFTLLTTFTSPTPVTDGGFGYSVAAVGTDRILIGAPADYTGAENAGAAYLFSTNGALLVTFTNPTLKVGGSFGCSVAAAGTDRVLIGAPGDYTGATEAGAAYLFSASGTLLTTFTNPTPTAFSAFGVSVTAVGSDRVLIAAIYDDTGALNAGAAHLFSTNGALLTTFTNPTPAAYDNFGVSVTAVGTDRVLIGAPADNTGAENAGAAYLFSTNGALLTTFTNPTPAAYDNFGVSVTAVGSDRVLIGAIGDATGADDAGAAYLFSASGALLTTFTNPTPAYYDHFGFSVAAVGTDRVLIGAHFDDTGAENAGAAYLFSANGTLLTAFTNPTPAYYDLFGFSVAALGSDRVLIGATDDHTGAPDAGAAYLFNIQPVLTIRLTTTNTVGVSWPSPSTGWTLQENTNDVASVNWSNAPGPIGDDGTNRTLIINPPEGNRFYRLLKPGG